MAYVRTKKVGGREYYQLVEGYREDGKVRQRMLAHLGRHQTPKAALADWERRAEWYREHALDLQHAAQYIREGRASSPYYGARRIKRLVPRHGTPFDSEPTVRGHALFGSMAGPGWFYSRGTAEEVEAEAQECIAKAEVYEARAERLRSVL